MASSTLKKRSSKGKVKAKLKKHSLDIKIEDVLEVMNRSISHLESQWDEIEAIQKRTLKMLENVK